MKVFIALLIALFTFTNATAATTEQHGKFVFVQTGQRIQITPVKHHSSIYNVVVYKAHPKVVFFSDMPKRDYGTIDNTQFINNWKLADNYFQTNPPSVLINYYDPAKNMNHEIKTGVFVLYHPQYSKKNHIVSYRAKQIAGSPIKPVYHYYPVIFIDDPNGAFHNCVRAMHCPLNGSLPKKK